MKAAKENVILYTYTIYNFAFTFFLFREIKILIFALDKLYCEKRLMKQTEQKKRTFLRRILTISLTIVVRKHRKATLTIRRHTRHIYV